jgi:hypothetical protein
MPDPKNVFEVSFSKVGEFFAHAGNFLKGIAVNVWCAFYPLLKSEAALFVAEFKGDAIQIAIRAAGEATVKDKIKFFGIEIAKVFLAKGKAEVRDHLVNLLREVVVAELKAKGIL